jgi:hypothetical protein
MKDQANSAKVVYTIRGLGLEAVVDAFYLAHVGKQGLHITAEKIRDHLKTRIKDTDKDDIVDRALLALSQQWLHATNKWDAPDVRGMSAGETADMLEDDLLNRRTLSISDGESVLLGDATLPNVNAHIDRSQRKLLEQAAAVQKKLVLRDVMEPQMKANAKLTVRQWRKRNAKKAA